MNQFQPLRIDLTKIKSILYLKTKCKFSFKKKVKFITARTAKLIRRLKDGFSHSKTIAY